MSSCEPAVLEKTHVSDRYGSLRVALCNTGRVVLLHLHRGAAHGLCVQLRDRLLLELTMVSTLHSYGD